MSGIDRNAIKGYKIAVYVPTGMGFEDKDGNIKYEVPNIGAEYVIDRKNVSMKVLDNETGNWLTSNMKDFVESIGLLERLEEQKKIKILATNVDGFWMEGKVKIEEEKSKTSFKTQKVSVY